MLTWSVLALVCIQWLMLRVFALALHVTRYCGQDINLLQTSTDVDLHPAANVEDTARIEAQWLIVHPGGRMTPRVPSNAIAYDSATAERTRDLSQKHIEVASQELYVITSDFLHQSIHECP